MDTRTLLAKAIQLIFRSRQIGLDDHDDLIRTVLGTVNVDKREQSFLGSNNTGRLKDYVVSLLDEKEPIDAENLIPTLSILLEHDPKLLNVIKESILTELNEGTIKRVISSSIKTLNNFYKEHLAMEVINRMSYDLKFNRNKIGSFSTYMQNALAELEPLSSMMTNIKDPSIVSEVDFEVDSSLDALFEEVRSLNSNNSVYKFGWQRLNAMCQGGIRRGEFATIGALQHKYKTGFSLSLFMQIAIHNTPIVTKEEAVAKKKPLLLRISFEDNLTNNLQFMCQYLSAMDGNMMSKEDFTNKPVDELRDFIMDKLKATGFSIKMFRIDPSQWSYNDIFNMVIKLEAEGYSVHVLALDYIGMVPTKGCVQGPAGVDFRDLLRRVRNFCSARNIAFLSPLQLSTEAKRLLRNGVAEHQLVKEVANLGYYANSSQLDQEIDLELFLHSFTHKGKGYITINRGKHRLPTMVDESQLYFMLPFPDRHTPVLPDIDGDDTSLDRLPKGSVDIEQTDLLSEVLG